MTLRLRRKHRITVRIRQLKSRVSRASQRIGWPIAFAALVLGLHVSESHAQQSTVKTFSPPVHITPGQPTAVQRFSGIAAPQGHTPDQSLIGSLPNRNRQADQPASNVQRNPRSPQLQARIARALSGIAGRTPDRQPTPAQPAPRVASNPIGNGVSQAASGQPMRQTVLRTNNGSPARDLRRSTNVTQAPARQQNTGQYPRVNRNQRAAYQTPPSRGFSGMPQNQPTVMASRYAAQRPQRDPRTLQRQPSSMQAPLYPVQQIQSQNVVQHSAHQNQPIGQSTPYYDRPDIQVTSGQEFDTEILVHDEPEMRVAQTPAIQDFAPRNANPVSVLNRPPAEPAGFSRGEYQGEFQNRLPQEPAVQDPGFVADPTIGNQNNNLRSDIANPQDDAEDIPSREDDDEIQRRSFDRSCDTIRNELLNSSITEIALDISPPKGPNESSFRPQVRTWTDQFGRVIGTGVITSLQQGYVIIDNNGSMQKLPYGNLSDPDLEVVAQFWQIPKECTVSQDMFTGRSWIPQTLTWKASNLCHKPLYFENVQLERYGHSHGPFSQPVHSAFHFFRSLAFLPYNTGINPPNECRYALGYYRPGNCAPWLVDPLPISLAGVKHQAQAMVGGGFLIIP